MIETLLRHDRAIIASALCLLTALAWLALLQGAGTGMSAAAMTTWQFPPPRVTPSIGAWNAAYWLTMLAMWWVMMVAMMVPSAAPMILLYARVARRSEARGHVAGTLVPTSFFAGGYLVLLARFQHARGWAPVCTGARRSHRRHDDVVDDPIAHCGAAVGGRSLSALAAEELLPRPVPLACRIPSPALARRPARRLPTRPRPRPILPWVLLGADAVVVRGRRHEPRMDRGPCDSRYWPRSSFHSVRNSPH